MSQPNYKDDEREAWVAFIDDINYKLQRGVITKQEAESLAAKWVQPKLKPQEESKVSDPKQPTLTEMVSIAVQTKTPAILWGPPGIGKTAIVNAICKHLNIPCETVISSLRDPTDFGGLPYIHEGIVNLAAPNWARRLCIAGEDATTNPVAGVAFFDEITCTPPAVQAALLRVILEKVVGEVQLPSNIAMLAAANPPDQAAGGWDLALPLLNRFMHIDCEVDAIKWADGFSNGWPTGAELTKLPKDWEESIPAIRAQISQFIKSAPNVILSIPKDGKTRAYPTPRSWDMLSRVLAATDLLNIDPSKFSAGIVGNGAGLQFNSFRQTRHHNLDATKAMAGDNSFEAHLAKAPLDAVSSFTTAIVAHVVSTNMSADKVIRAWHILFRIWLSRGKTLDTVFKTAMKLATATPVKPKAAFTTVPNSAEEEFVKAITDAAASHMGINLS